MTLTLEALQAALPALDAGFTADKIPFARISVADTESAVRTVREQLGHGRFVDLTAVDRLTREERFELQYLFYSMTDHSWVRLKARTDGEAFSITPMVPAANWYEREVYDLMGVRFEGHPDLRRIMLPEDWAGHPLRRDVPIGAEPVDFTVTRRVYGRD